MLARGRKTGHIFKTLSAPKKLKPLHLWYKQRQNATCGPALAGLPTNGANSRLFDRHGEPRDQTRNLIQLLAIKRFNDLR